MLCKDDVLNTSKRYDTNHESFPQEKVIMVVTQICPSKFQYVNNSFVGEALDYELSTTSNGDGRDVWRPSL